MTSARGVLHAELAGLHAQLEDLRQSKTVSALGQVASDASALLRAMSDASQCWPDGVQGSRINLTVALGTFTEAARTDLAVADRRSVELEHGPLAHELAAEKAVEDMVCPECHGFGQKVNCPPGSCPRCKGSGWIDPSTQVANGRDAS